MPARGKVPAFNAGIAPAREEMLRVLPDALASGGEARQMRGGEESPSPRIRMRWLRIRITPVSDLVVVRSMMTVMTLAVSMTTLPLWMAFVLVVGGAIPLAVLRHVV